MPAPRLVTTIDTGGEITLGGLLKLADQMACDLQDKHGQSPFLWFLRAGNSVTVLETRWENNDEKHANIAALRAILEEFPMIDAYASIMEVWMASYKNGERRRTQEVRNDPKRTSALLLFAIERSGARKEKMYEVTYDPTGRPYRKERKNMLGETAHASGFMVDLFKPPIKSPSFPVADA